MTTQQRHAKDRPLRSLTDHELDVLDQLGGSANLFRAHISRALIDLADLACHETAQRDYEKELRVASGS